VGTGHTHAPGRSRPITGGVARQTLASASDPLALLEFEWPGAIGEPRRLDVYRLRQRGTGRVRLATFAILDSPPEPAFLNVEWADGWPEPHGSDVVGGPQHVVLEEGWTEFIGSTW
jgi:hypothetical protein